MLRKSDIVENLSKDFGLTKQQSGDIVDAILDMIKEQLIKGNDVILGKFCTFSVKETMGRNVIVPSTGNVCEARLYKKLRCKFAKSFRDEVKQF